MNIIVYRNSNYPEILEQFQENVLNIELQFLASELFRFGFNNPNELELAINRAMQVCRTANLSINKNFKPVYTYKNGEMVCDWRLSDLGRKLVLLNADANNPLVARFQVELLRKLQDL